MQAGRTIRCAPFAGLTGGFIRALRGASELTPGEPLV